ncbi:MAG: tetraether lipid synthase Tes [Candidatus Hydrothermarchaeota archaeon]
MINIKRGKRTKSLCPECLRVIDARVFENEGQIKIEKTCLEHGTFDDIYWSDSGLLLKHMKYLRDGTKVKDPMTERRKGCPYDCGLCPEHKSPTILTNIDVTNRCNMRCPICFANASVQGYLYEPTKDQIVNMMLTVRNERPIPCSVLQFSGGEPTVREDLPELIRIAKELGFSQVQIATNGLKLARSVEYVKKLKKSGLNTVYLQFDGINEKPYIEARGFNALPLKLRAIENCRKAGLDSIVLVPTLVRGVNDDQIGSLINFSVKNSDVVRSLNVQPVSFAGRINKNELKKMRITIPDFLKLIEEQTNGAITKEDFYPVSAVGIVSDFLELWEKNPVPVPSCHPACGTATFVFVDNGKLVPITRFIDVEGFLELTKDIIEESDTKGKIGKIRALAKLSTEFLKLVDFDIMPKSSNIPKIIMKIMKEGNKDVLAELFESTLFIGCMHFQDLYNIDKERIQRCVIHYAVPDGRVIPFCTYNLLYREEVERRFSTPLYNSEFRKND